MKERTDHAKELADQHWKYIKNLLLIHKVESPELITIGFHYKSALIHGYKHGWDDAQEKKKN